MPKKYVCTGDFSQEGRKTNHKGVQEHCTVHRDGGRQLRHHPGGR